MPKKHGSRNFLTPIVPSTSWLFVSMKVSQCGWQCGSIAKTWLSRWVPGRWAQEKTLHLSYIPFVFHPSDPSARGSSEGKPLLSPSLGPVSLTLLCTAVTTPASVRAPWRQQVSVGLFEQSVFSTKWVARKKAWARVCPCSLVQCLGHNIDSVNDCWVDEEIHKCHQRGMNPRVKSNFLLIKHKTHPLSSNFQESDA